MGEDEFIKELWEDILAYVNDIEDDEENARMLIEIGIMLTEEEEWERAELLLSEAKTITHNIEDRAERAKLLYTLVKTFIKLDRQEDADDTWKEAEGATHAIQPFIERAEALITLGTILYDKQALQEAKIVWQEVDTMARTMEKGRKSIQIMVELCTALTQAQCWNWMRSIWKYVKEILVSVENNWLSEVDLEETDDPILLDQALITLGMTFINDLQWDLVSEVAHFISNPQEQANILQQLGLAICKTQQWDQTKTIWNEIRNVSALSEEDEGSIQTSTDIYFDWTSQIKVIVLVELGLQLYKAQRYKQAKEIWSEVETLIHKERDDWLKAELLRNLGIALAQCQQWQWAKAVAYAISANWAKTEVLIELSLQFHKAHHYDSAEKLWGEIEKSICMIKEYPMRAKGFQQLGTMLFMIGKEKCAEEIWNQAEKAIYMISKGQIQDEALVH